MEPVSPPPPIPPDAPLRIARLSLAAFALGALAMIAVAAGVILWVQADEAERRAVKTEERWNEAVRIVRSERETAQAERELRLAAEVSLDRAMQMLAQVPEGSLPPQELALTLGAVSEYFDAHPGAAEDPLVAARRLALDIAHARALVGAGKLAGALAVARAAAEHAEMQAARPGALPAARHEAIDAAILHAELLFQNAQPADARAAAVAAREKAGPLRETAAGPLLYARASRLLGQLAVEAGSTEEAAAYFTDALTMLEPLAEKEPTQQTHAELCESLQQLAGFAAMRGEQRAALALANRAVDAARKIYPPGEALAFALARVAAADIALGGAEAADPCLREAIPIVAMLESRPAQTPSLRRLQKVTYQAAADLARSRGQLPDAVEFQRRADLAEKAIVPRVEPPAQPLEVPKLEL